MPSHWLAVAPGVDPRVRARRLRQSWERLLAGRDLKAESGPELTGGLRQPIVESWRRSLDTGLDPAGWTAPIEADPSEIRERWVEHPLGALAQVLAEQLYTMAEDSQSLIVVSDASGLLLHVHGADWLKERAADDMNFLEGARWSEAAAGTNAIGTALATNHALQVFGFEHFNQREHGWTCSAAPVHDPVTGQLLGIVDLTGPWKTVHPLGLALATAAAKTMEEGLADARRDHHARLQRRYGDLATRGTDLLVSPDGYVLAGERLATPPRPLTIPEGGGEILLGDGSFAAAEPLGHGEAYLVRGIGRSSVGAAPTKAPERADEDADEEPKGSLRAAKVESGWPGAEPGQRAVGAYFEAALDCVIMADASGRVVEFNPAAERTFGYSRDEALGRTMAELIVPPSLRERHSTAFARFTETGHGTMLGRRLELTGMRADGSEFPVELALSQVEADPFLICGALRDISAAKQAEGHLRELADEQAALRRVATLVARESSPRRLFALVAEQVGRIIDVPLVRLVRYESDGSAAELIGGWGESVDPLAVGTRWQLDGPGVLASVWRSGLPARLDDYTDVPGQAAVVVRQAGMRSAVASPITVEGRLWGAIAVMSPTLEPLPEDTEERLSDFTELVATALANAESRAELAASETRARTLAEEQAALRRVATLVAREASPVELLATVAEEVARVLDVEAVGIDRFESDGTGTLVAQSDTPWDPPPLGARFTLEGENVVTAVFRTGQAARLDDWSEATGQVADMARAVGIRSSVATPIVVEGRLWGTLIAVTGQSEPLPRETESRIGEFTELVATAIANAGARDDLSRLLEEQAALRRVATLVAEGAAPSEVFDAVIKEVGQLLGAAQVGLARYESEHEISVLAIRGQSPEILRTGVRLPLDGDSLNARILRTGRSARLNFAEEGDGTIADVLRRDHVTATVGAPIVVDGALWGIIGASWKGDDQPPANAEKRVEKFTELVATAIANTESRAALAASEARARDLAGEQAALRRVATLVAEGASSDELFAAVTGEAADVLDVPVVALQRYEPDRTFTMVAIAGETSFTVGSRWPVEDEGIAGMILATGGPATKHDYTTMAGPLGAALRDGGLISAVGVPIVVEGSIWGFMTAGARPGKPIPDATEERLARFTELVATAIADSHSREQLAQLGYEQAALRRVATLVADGAKSEAVFSAVAQEVAHVFDVQHVTVCHYEPDAILILSSFEGAEPAAAPPPFPAGHRLSLDAPSLPAAIHRTGEPARIDDFTASDGLYAVARQAGLTGAVGVPIVVDGTVWGAVNIASTKNERFPPDAEERLARFTELIATSVSNATMREELAASRARVIAASDETRRRIERDLHDGAQQQLVTLALGLRATEGRVPVGMDDLKTEVAHVADRLTSVIDELREMSRGIHPAILTEGGLSPALEALALRSSVPVKLNVRCQHRLPDKIEVAAYYVTSEALTNAAKHANASHVQVDLRAEEGALSLSIRDDGAGGADPSGGSGLLGIKDRVEALGGTIEVKSPPGEGTWLDVEIPLSPDRSAELDLQPLSPL
jgi:PAS domain S-box-containing protein